VQGWQFAHGWLELAEGVSSITNRRSRMKYTLLLTLAAAALCAEPAGITQKRTLTLAGARTVIAAAVSQAHQLRTTGVIAVVDDGGNLMAVERLDGTFAAGGNISIGKARTAALFKMPTRFFEDVIGKGRTSMVALMDFTPLQGGVPLVVDGEVVGAVGVSGAASAAQDEELAMAGAAALNRTPQVTFFEAGKVTAAFAKGAVLFDSSDKYMIHASRREQPGVAEIHTLDADIIYVLDGTATVVTGGEAVDAKVTGMGELRGSGIRDGATRRVGKGDVLVIPAGVPHWFKEVSQPFLYYVVKAR
jgi:glc operon protein GlcG